MFENMMQAEWTPMLIRLILLFCGVIIFNFVIFRKIIGRLPSLNLHRTIIGIGLKVICYGFVIMATMVLFSCIAFAVFGIVNAEIFASFAEVPEVRHFLTNNIWTVAWLLCAVYLILNALEIFIFGRMNLRESSGPVPGVRSGGEALNRRKLW